MATKQNKSRVKATILQIADLTGKDFVTNPGKCRGRIGGSDNRPWNAIINAKQDEYNKIEGTTNVAKEKRSALAKVSAQSFFFICAFGTFFLLLLLPLLLFS